MLLAGLAGGGLTGCTDSEARAELEKAMQEIDQLQDRLQAAETLLNRVYRGYINTPMVGEAGDPADQGTRNSQGVSIFGDQTARDMAQASMDAANASQACCEANEERIFRMYEIIKPILE
jgi:hypothetical protein